MPSLVEIVSNIYDDPQVVEDLKPDLEELEYLIRNDDESRLAQTMVEIIDDNQLMSPEDMEDFQKMVNEYQASKNEQLMFPEIGYDFQPPSGLMDELGMLEAQFPGLSDTSDEDDPTETIGEALPVIPMPDEDDDYDLEEDQEWSPPQSVLNHLSNMMQTAPKEELPMKTVSVYLNAIGRIDYEVIDVVETRFSLNLVFDPKRSKPPFYPEVGLAFDLEYASRVKRVVYAGVCFDYEDKRFMCFSVIGD